MICELYAHNLPFMSHVGFVLDHDKSAWQVRIVKAESVYPVSQVNVAVDPYVVPLVYVDKPFATASTAPQSTIIT